MFLGSLNPDPSFVWIRILPSTSKTSKKNLDFYFFFLVLCDILSSQTDVNVPSKSKSKKNVGKNLLIVGILPATDEKSRIWFLNEMSRIHIPQH